MKLLFSIVLAFVSWIWGLAFYMQSGERHYPPFFHTWYGFPLLITIGLSFAVILILIVMKINKE